MDRLSVGCGQKCFYFFIFTLDLTAIKVKPGGRFNLTDFDDNLALVIAETQDKKSSDIFESIKEQGIIKSFIHPTKTSSKWTIKAEDGKPIKNFYYYSLTNSEIPNFREFFSKSERIIDVGGHSTTT